MKPIYRSVYPVVDGIDYVVHCRIIPPRAYSRSGAGTPRFLDPGSPPRVQILRILRDRVDVTTDLLWFTRAKVTEAACAEAFTWINCHMLVCRERRARSTRRRRSA